MYQTIFEMIDTRSFSSFWYWIVVAFAWSAASHWTLGVPYDLVRRARHHEAAQHDLELFVRVALGRRGAGESFLDPVTAALVSAALTATAILGFGYGVEIAQAVILLAAPLVLVWTFDRRSARALVRDGVSGPALNRRLRLVRLRTQAVGAVAIFLTALWGTWWNLAVGPFGL